MLWRNKAIIMITGGAQMSYRIYCFVDHLVIAAIIIIINGTPWHSTIAHAADVIGGANR